MSKQFLNKLLIFLVFKVFGQAILNFLLDFQQREEFLSQYCLAYVCKGNVEEQTMDDQCKTVIG